jgi:multidrug efflux system membrane fusion protein
MRRIVVVGMLVALSACGSVDEPAVSPAATPVRVAKVTSGPAVPPIRTTGVVANEDEYRLSFKVGGIVKSIAVNQGDTVREGQRLAEIEQAEVDAQVEQARQALEKAKRDAERGERLYADQVISLEQLQDLKTQLAVSEAAFRSAQFNRNYSTIVAPRDGTILRRLADERELVGPGAPILVLGTQSGFVVRAGLADREVVQIKPGDRARVRLDALPDTILEGAVTEVATAANPASGLFDIELALKHTDTPLRSGLLAKVTIHPFAADSASLSYVPIAAIVEGEGLRASVFVLENGHARQRAVRVAFIEGESVALADGANVGETVITDGALYLEDGEAVSVEESLASTAR